MTPTDPTTEDLVRRINDQQFDPVRLRPGYEMGAVDDLLDRVVAALRAGTPTPSLTAEPLDVVRFREAYAVESVDSFLQELSEILDARQDRMEAEPAAREVLRAHGAQAQIPIDRPEPVNVIQEQQSLWQRLLGPE